MSLTNRRCSIGPNSPKILCKVSSVVAKLSLPTNKVFRGFPLILGSLLGLSRSVSKHKNARTRSIQRSNYSTIVRNHIYAIYATSFHRVVVFLSSIFQSLSYPLSLMLTSLGVLDQSVVCTTQFASPPLQLPLPLPLFEWSSLVPLEVSTPIGSYKPIAGPHKRMEGTCSRFF